MYPCAPVFTLAAFPSSVSMCMASLKLGSTRTSTSPKIKFAVSRDAHAHEGFIADSVAKRVFRASCEYAATRK